MPGYTDKPKKERFDQPKPNVEQILKATGKHDILLKLLKEAKLLNALKAGDKMTIFAPTDSAFSKIKTEDSIKDVLLKHVLQYSSSPPPNWRKMKTFKTLSNVKINADKVKQYMENKGIKAINGSTIFSIPIVL